MVNRLSSLRDEEGRSALEAIQRVAPGICSEDPNYDWGKYFRAHQWRMARDLKSCWRFLRRTGELLEIGSTPPYLLAALKAEGYSVVGVDYEPARFSGTLTRLGLIVHRVNIEEERLPFEDCRFANVIMNEVFEHLRLNPIFTLSEVHRVLAPGGRLLLSTPNLLSFRAICNAMRTGKLFTVAPSVYGEYSKLKTLGMMGHVREYCPADVEEFCRCSGFDVIRRIYRPQGGGWLDRAISSVIPKLSANFSLVLEKLELVTAGGRKKSTNELPE